MQRMPLPHSEVASYERLPPPQQSLKNMASQQFKVPQHNCNNEAGFDQPNITRPPPQPPKKVEIGRGNDSQPYIAQPPLIPSPTSSFDRNQKENTIKKEFMLPKQQQEQLENPVSLHSAIKQSSGYENLIGPDQAQHNVVQNVLPHYATYTVNRPNPVQFEQYSNMDTVTNLPPLRNTGPIQNVLEQETHIQPPF